MKGALIVAWAVLTVAGATAQSVDYAAPDGAFAIRPPAGWSVTRTAAGQGGFATAFAAGPEETSAKIEIVTFAVGVNRTTVDDVAEALLAPILRNLQAEGRILSQQSQRTKVGGLAAIRFDLVYQSKRSDEPEQGYMLAILGRRFAILAVVSARRTDDANLRAGLAAMATLAIETASPGRTPPG